MKNIEIMIQPLGLQVRYEALTFSGGERHIQITDIVDPCHPLIKEKSLEIPDFIGDLKLEITADIRSCENLMDLLLVVDATNNLISLDQHYASAPIDLTIPYLPYARQDRVCAPGQAFSIEVFSNVLNTMNINSITVWDVHSEAALEALCNRTYNVSQVEMLSNPKNWKFSKYFTSDVINPIIVCPDKGATKRTENIRSLFANRNDIIYCTKIRDPETGWITDTKIDAKAGLDLKGRNCIIPDDICDGGMTFIKIAEKLKSLGAAQITLFVTHGIFSKGFEPFNGLIDEFWTTRSLIKGLIDSNPENPPGIVPNLNLKIVEV